VSDAAAWVQARLILVEVEDGAYSGPFSVVVRNHSDHPILDVTLTSATYQTSPNATLECDDRTVSIVKSDESHEFPIDFKNDRGESIFPFSTDLGPVAVIRYEGADRAAVSAFVEWSDVEGLRWKRAVTGDPQRADALGG
jgi:hypothetical protein